MESEGAGTAKISKIELVDLTPEDVKKASEVQTGPDGSKAQLPLKATKKLKITIETKDANGSSSSSSENFIAEKGIDPRLRQRRGGCEGFLHQMRLKFVWRRMAG
jgi:hypothetical protein